MSPLDTLLLALSRNGTRVRLTLSGTLKLAGTPLSPALLAEVKAHKPEMVAALHEARDLAADLVRSGETETFARELADARTRGTLTVVDRCAARLALRLARQWQTERQEQAA